MTTKVQALIDALRADGFVNVEWAHTGGGCYAVCIPLGDGTPDDMSQILITGEDVFYADDLDSDEQVNGEWYADLYGPDGDSTTEGRGIVLTMDTPALIAAINLAIGVSTDAPPRGSRVWSRRREMWGIVTDGVVHIDRTHGDERPYVWVDFGADCVGGVYLADLTDGSDLGAVTA